MCLGIGSRFGLCALNKFSPRFFLLAIADRYLAASHHRSSPTAGAKKSPRLSPKKGDGDSDFFSPYWGLGLTSIIYDLRLLLLLCVLDRLVRPAAYSLANIDRLRTCLCRAAAPPLVRSHLHTSARLAVPTPHQWFVALGIAKGQRIPIQRTILVSDTIEEKVAKLASMTQRLEQDVAAAASAATAAPADTVAPEADAAQSTKRPLEDTSAATDAPAEAAAEESVKKARFDDSATRGGKKKWERRDRRGTGRSDEREAASDPSGSSGDRLPKRKVAVKFGYCGIGYSGLQINPGVKTIEGDIFDAFCTAGAVSKDNAVNPNKVGLQRAARTDRGVHAAGNLLSLKLILQPDGLQEGETLVDKVNSLLPEFIRIWGVTRVQNGFNARQSCDSRMYEYLLPTYVFIPPKPGSTMHEMLKRLRDEELAKLKESNPDADSTSLDEVIAHPFWSAHGTEHDFATDVAAKKKYRLSETELERIRKIFAKFSGSHNFHNFTVGKEFRDRSCQRFMKTLTISPAKLIGDCEWVSIKLHGQSFMLHQIRKMVGLLVLVGRSGAGMGLVDECFGPARVHIPKAPGLGLLLEQPIFEAYNRRIGNNNDKLTRLMKKSDNPGLQDELREGVGYKDHEDQMTKFKQAWIYDRITATEADTAEFAKWLNYLDVFQGPDFEYLNPKGVIPAKAIVKVGEFHRDASKHAKKDGDQHNQDQDDDDEDKEAYAMKGNQLDEYEG